MKIAGPKTIISNVSRTNAMFVRSNTDEGIDRVGEATLQWTPKTVVAAMDGLDGFSLAAIPLPAMPIQRASSDSYWRTGTVSSATTAEVRATNPVPIAAGERWYEPGHADQQPGQSAGLGQLNAWD